jgi:hypothetical protein
MRVIALAMGLALLLTAMTPAVSHAKAERQEPGGAMAFFVGACWGIRAGGEWNEGADLHWREWCRLIPFVNVGVAIWDGVECMNGVTAHKWAETNGANWY